MGCESNYTDIIPKKRYLVRAYLGAMFWFVGRAFQAAWRLDERIREEFEILPADFSFLITVFPNGPGIVLKKDEQGRLRFRGKSMSTFDPGPQQREADVNIRFRTAASALRVFTFQISVYTAYAQNGISVSGDLAATMGIMRCLALVEDYLIPRMITRRILKRKPRTPCMKRHLRRLALYICVVLGI
mgnify:CR=1 FL=1